MARCADQPTMLRLVEAAMEDVIELGAGDRLARQGEDRRYAACPGQRDWASKLQWSVDMVAARL